MTHRWSYIGRLLAHYLMVLLASAGAASGYAPHGHGTAEPVVAPPVWWRSEARRGWLDLVRELKQEQGK